MNPSGQRAEIDQPMQPLPAHETEAPNPSGGGCDGQRNQQNEPSHANGDETALHHILPHFLNIEKLVQPHPSGQVEASIKECEKAQHPPETRQLGLVQQNSKRSDAKGKEQEAQGPITGGMGDVLDGVGSQLVMVAAPSQQE